MPLKESIIKRNCRNQLEKWGWLVVYYIQTNCNGWPDTQIMRKGVTYFLEFKKPGKVARALQEYRHKQIREAGFEVYIVKKPDDIARFV